MTFKYGRELEPNPQIRPGIGAVAFVIIGSFRTILIIMLPANHTKGSCSLKKKLDHGSITPIKSLRILCSFFLHNSHKQAWPPSTSSVTPMPAAAASRCESCSQSPASLRYYPSPAHSHSHSQSPSHPPAPSPSLPPSPSPSPSPSHSHSPIAGKSEVRASTPVQCERVS